MGRDLAALVCLMLLLSPMSSKAHYVFLWLPSLWFARHCVTFPSRTSLALCTLLLVTGPLSTKGLVGKHWGDTLLAWGLPTWFVLIQLASLWRLSGNVMHELTIHDQTAKPDSEFTHNESDSPHILPFPTSVTTTDRRRVA